MPTAFPTPGTRRHGGRPGRRAEGCARAARGAGFGWSGQIAEATATEPSEFKVGRITYATLDLGREDYRRFYQGFANGSLWPTLHYRLGLAHFSREDHAGYGRVNTAFATALAPMLRPDDTIWAHDFHLFPFGAALRRLGCRQRIGFFLHVPFPPGGLFCALPRSEEVLADLAAYDVIGVQTEDDAANLRGALEAAGQAEAVARVQAFPIGIEAEPFTVLAEKAITKRETERFRTSPGRPRADHRRRPAGLHQGPAAALLRLRPAAWRGSRATGPRSPDLQVAPVSRGDVAQYRSLGGSSTNGRPHQRRLCRAGLGAAALHDPRRRAPGAGRLHALARVGLVTPLRDGMNLVAKEYIAAQDPDDPGVLVLSRFAGAVAQLPGALLVNPLDPDEIAEALDQALSMKREERRARFEDCAVSVRQDGARAWCREFLGVLEGANDA